jgi:hypothetical protein
MTIIIASKQYLLLTRMQEMVVSRAEFDSASYQERRIQ